MRLRPAAVWRLSAGSSPEHAPLQTLARRVRKYAQRGYQVDVPATMKLCGDVQETPGGILMLVQQTLRNVEKKKKEVY
jgi:hypothetical protein